jgi:hypothetical protein
LVQVLLEHARQNLVEISGRSGRRHQAGHARLVETTRVSQRREEDTSLLNGHLTFVVQQRADEISPAGLG